MEHFISEALRLPTTVIAYNTSQQLTALLPQKVMLETMECSFDVQEYARAGLCTLILNPALHNQVLVGPNMEHTALVERAENAWFHVEWQGHALDVLSLSWKEGWSNVQYSWLLADTHEVAEQFFLQVCKWNSEIRDEVLVFEDGMWIKNPELFQTIKNATFDNLVLAGTLKQDIHADLLHFFASRHTYESYGVPWKRGILLIGPPGNGKTHTVKALINALDKPCLYVKSFNSEHSTDNGNIRAVFDRARASAPCVLVLEDLDALVTDTNRSFFLNELDGFASNTGVVLIATTNHPDRLDPAIVNRPSRFDRKYHFALPELSERLAYIMLWNQALRPALQLSTASAALIAEQTEGFSFAYLKELFLSATMAWMTTQEPGTMERVIREQVTVLRAQMVSSIESPQTNSDQIQNHSDL